MNWDKPLTLNQMIAQNDITTMKYHGFTKFNWNAFVCECGYKDGDGWEGFYPKYLNYCKMRLSPLYQALG